MRNYIEKRAGVKAIWIGIRDRHRDSQRSGRQRAAACVPLNTQGRARSLRGTFSRLDLRAAAMPSLGLNEFPPLAKGLAGLLLVGGAASHFKPIKATLGLVAARATARPWTLLSCAFLSDSFLTVSSNGRRKICIVKTVLQSSCILNRASRRWRFRRCLVALCSARVKQLLSRTKHASSTVGQLVANIMPFWCLARRCRALPARP